MPPLRPKDNPALTHRGTQNSSRVAESVRSASTSGSPTPAPIPFPTLPALPDSSPTSPILSIMPNPLGLSDDQWAAVQQLISASVAAAVVNLPAAQPRPKPIEFNPPDEFDGSDPSKVTDLFNQCDLVFRSRSEQFPDDETRINYAASYLRGQAQRWFMPHLAAVPPTALADGSLPPTVTTSWPKFKNEISATFGQSDLARTAAMKLSNLAMSDHHHVMKYSIDFKELASHLPDLSDTSLFSDYYRGLAPRIKDDLAKHPWPNSFVDLVTLTRSIDQRYWDRKEEQARESRRSANRTPTSFPAPISSPSTSSSSISTSATSASSDKRDKRSASPAVNLSGIIGPDGKLTAIEKQRRRDLGLCNFCGSSEHLRDFCTLAPPKTPTPGTSARASATSPNIAGSSPSA